MNYRLPLLAALMHASWNALVKSEGDALASFAVIMGVGGLFAGLALPCLPAPAPETTPYLVASIAIHNVYYFFLLRSYKFGDLSHVYSIPRGMGPLLVALVSARVLGEHVSVLDATGVALVSSGSMSLTLANGPLRRDELRPTAYALANGVTIAAYSVVDGVGARPRAAVAPAPIGGTQRRRRRAGRRRLRNRDLGHEPWHHGQRGRAARDVGALRSTDRNKGRG